MSFAVKKKYFKYETAKEIELRIARYFGTRRCVIVPNVSWGLLPYEADMLVMPKSGILYEIEIKVSRGDLIADKKKEHTHNSDLIRELYFAIPQKLENHIEHIPEKAGILIVEETGRVRKLRDAKINESASKLSLEDRFKLARLGTMRIWNLKSDIINLQREMVKLEHPEPMEEK